MTAPEPPRSTGARERPTALHRSVFARLVAIMMVMGACLVAMVGGFYFVIVIPGLHVSLDRLVGQHARAIADSRPDSASARTLAERLDMQVRYEGPDGAWATDPGVPTLEGIRNLQHHHHPFSHWFVPRQTFYVVPTDRGHYVFARAFGRNFGRAHNQMLLVLLSLMIGVFAMAYWVMRRALRPLKLLGAGVAQLGQGQLDVVVPKQSEDEFGALTDAFNRMVRRVSDMVRSRDQLLLDVSHELRSPLTRMKVALAMMPDGAQKHSMATDVAEMETLVSQLLELERLREGRAVKTTRQDLIALLREEVERYRDRPPGVRLAAAPAESWLELDGDRVRTVMRNLIDNALKFSLPDSRPVEISVAELGDTVEVRVADDGPGIPEGGARDLFEPFVRLDPSRSKKTGGYGLGLSMCKRIMEAHGGKIAVERPSRGRGATFVLSFPLRAFPVFPAEIARSGP